MAFRTRTDRKRPASVPLPQPIVQDSEYEEEESAMNKRALNIKENKEMLAKLLAELNKVPKLLPGKRMAKTDASRVTSGTMDSLENPRSLDPPPHTVPLSGEWTFQPATRGR
ncbi:hypothetical protein AMECASPLE_035121 [Ameca splendens]|uniref:Uncharacterized protein n=1 Tax=Ameca splendens TaxID=208324 RepID=A0ABV0ZG30_9TELE